MGSNTWRGVISTMSMFRDLGFGNKACGQFRRLQTGTRGTFLPRFGPPEGNTVRPACLGLISVGCYKGEIAIARKAKAIVSYGVVFLFGCLSWPYIDGQVSRSTPSRSTKQKFPYTNLPCVLLFVPLCQCRIEIAFDTAIVLGPLGLRLELFSIYFCWAGPGVPKWGTQKVMPMSVAPKCLVESKTRART